MLNSQGPEGPRGRRGLNGTLTYTHANVRRFHGERGMKLRPASGASWQGKIGPCIETSTCGQRPRYLCGIVEMRQFTVSKKEVVC